MVDISSLTEKDKNFLKALKAKGKTMEEAFQLLEKVKSSAPVEQEQKTQGQSAASTLLESGMIGDLKEKADPTYQKPSIFGALPEKIEEEGFVKGVVSGGLENIKTGIEATGLPDILRGSIESVKEGASAIKDVVQGAISEAGPMSEGESVEDREDTATFVGGVSDVIGGGLSAVFSPLTAIIEKTPVVDTLFEKISEGVDSTSGFLADKIGTTEAEKEALKKSFNNLFALGTIKYGPKATEKIMETSSSVLSKPKEVAKFVGSEAAQKSTGLTTETMKSIVENPQKFKTVSDLGQDASRVNLFEKVKSAMDERISQLSETGKLYETIRNSENKVKLSDDFWDTVLKDYKLTVNPSTKRIIASSESKIRQTKDISSLQEIYGLYGGKTEFTANEYLNLRKDLATMAKYAEGKTDAATALAKDIRAKANQTAHKQIPELKKADAEYSTEVEYLNSIKNMIYDKSGNVKDNAISTLSNLTGKGKEFKLERLEKLLPDLAADLKALKALQNVEIAQGTAVGQYGRNIAAGAALYSGNLPLAAFLVLTNPRIVSRLLQLYGESKLKVNSQMISKIQKKIENGVEVSQSEAALIKKLIDALTTEEASVVFADTALQSNE